MAFILTVSSSETGLGKKLNASKFLLVSIIARGAFGSLYFIENCNESEEFIAFIKEYLI